MAYSDFMRIYETRTVAELVAFSSSGDSQLSVETGSRAIVTLSVTAIDADTTVSVQVKTGFGASDPFITLGTVSASSISQVKQAFSDFNSLFDFRYTVTGGNATFKIAVTLADNSGGSSSSDDLSMRQKILNAVDTVGTVTWADFGTDAARVLSVAYTSATYPGLTLTKTLTYTLTGGRYRFDSVAWTLE